jgi:hypothetical protein
MEIGSEIIEGEQRAPTEKSVIETFEWLASFHSTLISCQRGEGHVNSVKSEPVVRWAESKVASGLLLAAIAAG